MAETDRDRTVRMLVGIVGIAFILAGIYGFYDPTVFGLFDLTMGHNWVHVLTGIVYTVVGFAPIELNIVAWVSRVGGIVYGLLGVVGFFAPNILSPLMVLGVNENVFHITMGIVITVLGFMLPIHAGTETERTGTPATERR